MKDKKKTEIKPVEKNKEDKPKTKYDYLLIDLKEKGIGTMKCFGNSMTPIIQSGSTLTFAKCEKYNKGDIVFCRVKGRYIDAHLITKVGNDGRYMISNNHGFDNGWTKTVYAKVIKIEAPK